MNLVKIASAGETGLLQVTVPAAVQAIAAGFSFQLPTQLSVGIPAEVPIAVSTVDGRELPSWLTFDKSARTFTAKNVPAGSLPLRVLVNVSGLSYAVDIVTTNDVL